VVQSIAIAAFAGAVKRGLDGRLKIEIGEHSDGIHKVMRCPKLTGSSVPIKGLAHPRRPILPFDPVGSNISSQPAFPV
jgi:hypothetical protein